MLTLNKNERKSIRAAYGKALAEAGRENKNVVVLDSDLAGSTQTAIFAKEFPQRWFDCGIAEADMTTTAVGLASVGKIPFISSFAVFATGRNYDQIRNGACYAGFNIKVVGTHGGITVGEDGATHQALEDVSLMRGIPGMQVLVPSDCAEMNAAVKYAAKHFGPVYIRVPRTNVPDVFEENHQFDMTKAVVLKEGKDVTVITNGETTAEVIEASEILAKNGIDVEIVHMPMVKPMDRETVLASAKKTGFVITVENHSVIGGVGSAVCELLCETHPVPVHRLGIQDTFGQSGDFNSLMKYYRLNSKELAEDITKIMETK
ncbi:transketolase family protein [bacterium]|nr:transketolase family protein [bacterium]